MGGKGGILACNGGLGPDGRAGRAALPRLQSAMDSTPVGGPARASRASCPGLFHQGQSHPAASAQRRRDLATVAPQNTHLNDLSLLQAAHVGVSHRQRHRLLRSQNKSGRQRGREAGGDTRAAQERLYTVTSRRAPSTGLDEASMVLAARLAKQRVAVPSQAGSRFHAKQAARVARQEVQAGAAGLAEWRLTWSSKLSSSSSLRLVTR